MHYRATIAWRRGNTTVFTHSVRISCCDNLKRAIRVVIARYGNRLRDLEIRIYEDTWLVAEKPYGKLRFVHFKGRKERWLTLQTTK